MRETLLDRRVHAYQEMYVLPRAALPILTTKQESRFCKETLFARTKQEIELSGSKKQAGIWLSPSFYRDSDLIAILHQRLLDFNPAI